MLIAFLTTQSARAVLRGRVKNKENVVGKRIFWTEMKFTENLNPRKLQICDIYCLKSHVRRNTEFWIFGRNGGRSEKSWAWTFFGEEYVSTIINRGRRRFQTINRKKCHLRLIVLLKGLLSQIIVKFALRKLITTCSNIPFFFLLRRFRWFDAFRSIMPLQIIWWVWTGNAIGKPDTLSLNMSLDLYLWNEPHMGDTVWLPISLLV